MKIVYWIATGLLCLLMLASAGMYIFNHAAVLGIFTNLGYPTYIVYPLAIAKILGVIAILSKQSKTLKEWAYAGLLFDLIGALYSLEMIGGGIQAVVGMGIPIIIGAVSYIYHHKKLKIG